jgi:hypothetical protein
MQGYDLIEDMYSAKTAAMNLVSELCKQRTKGNLDAFMQFIVQVMTEYQVRPPHHPHLLLIEVKQVLFKT